MGYYLSDLFTQTRDTDPDLRFMALNDLEKELTGPDSKFTQDSKVEYADILLLCLDDEFAEVRSESLKCLESLTPVLGPYVSDILQKLSTKKQDDVSITSSIYTMAIHNILRNLIPDDATAKHIVSTLLNSCLADEHTFFTRIDSIEVLTDLLEYLGRFFNQKQQADTAEVLTRASFKADAIIAKKSVTALALMVRYSTSVSNILQDIFDYVELEPTQQNITVALSIISALIKANPPVMARDFERVRPFITESLSLDSLSGTDDDFDVQQELDETRSEALQCLVSAFQYLPASLMENYATESLEIASKFVLYDPYGQIGEDDDSMEDDDDSDYYSDESDYEDEDDYGSGLSWKLRRASDTLVYTILHRLPTRLPLIYSYVFSQLIEQFKDKNSAVITELLKALTEIFTYSGKDGPYYTLKALSSLNEYTHGRRKSNVSMQTDDDPFVLLISRSAEICEAFIKLLTPSNAGMLNEFYGFVSALSTATEGIDTPWPNVLITDLDKLRDGPPTSELIRLYASLLATTSLQGFESGLQVIVDNITACLKSANHELVLDALLLLNEILSIYIKRDSPGLDSLQPFALLDGLLIEKTDKIYSTEIRQQSLVTLSNLILNVPLTSILTSLEVFTNSITQEFLVTVDMQCIQNLVGQDNIRSQITPEWTDHILHPLLDYAANPELRVEALATVQSLEDAQLLTESQHVQVTESLLDLCNHNLNTESQICVAKVLSTNGPGYLKPITEQLVKFSKNEEFDAATLSNLTKSLLTNTDPNTLMEIILKHGTHSDPNISKLLAIISVAAKHNESIDGILEDLKNGNQPLFSLIFLNQVAKSATLDTDLLLFFQYLDSSDLQLKKAGSDAIAAIVSSNPHKYIEDFLTNLEAAQDKSQALNCLSEILKNVNPSPENAQRIFNTVCKIQDSVNEVTEKDFVPAAVSLSKIALNNEDFVENLCEVLDTEHSLALKASAASAMKYLLDSDQFMIENAPLLNQYLDSSTADNFIFNSVLPLKEIGVANMLQALYKRPSLALPLVSRILPAILESELIQRKEYVKVIRIGPFKHKLDDALSFRKNLYEMLYSMLTTLEGNPNLSVLCQVDWETVFRTIVTRAFKDDPTIIFLCLLIIQKILALEPELLQGNDLMPLLIQVCNKKLNKHLKEEAPKQDIEKHNDTVKAILRCLKKVNAMINGGQIKLDGDVMAEWKSFVNQLRIRFPIFDSEE